ncbi:MAG: ribokinase [Lachnospiraceae bacterium]|nr:ribokinase [Lachnospiraceae bacterium]
MLKKPKILVVGSFNMDLIASTERAPGSGETVIGRKFRTAPGGKGFNQAVQCARLGAEVTMAGKVGGDDFGKALLQEAKGVGIDVSRVLTDPDEATGVALIILEEKGNTTQNRITVCPGANFTITSEEIDWIRTEVGHYDMVIMQFELPMGVVEDVAEWAHEAGVPVMINPAPAAPMSERLLRSATFLSPNEHEAAILAGHEIRVEDGIHFDDVEMVADHFRKLGVKNLIITMGENGAIAAGEKEIHHTQCVRMPKVADPTAAGDSFVAAFCTGLTAGLADGEALAFASHAAAITVSRMGAMPSLPTTSEVQALIRERGYNGFDPALLDALK